ncbi:MAG TPA: hypothetical protein VJV23_05980 [Candidatus Polarisedimenticolia bacterium]|nr:hypothetical protein [Candidatus Polarisedimenticolia bacterium]
MAPPEGAMDRCGTSEQDLVLLLYGELEETARRGVSSHAAACDACRDRLDALRAAFALVERSGFGQRRPEDLASQWAPLRARLAAESRPSGRYGSLLPLLAKAAAVLVLAGASFWVGRVWDGGSLMPGRHPGDAVSGEAPLDGQARLLAFSERTNDYLDRSRLVLLELSNGELSTDSMALSQASRTLLRENPAARRVARQIADQRLQDLVEEIESILSQISRLPQGEQDGLDRLRTYVNNSGVLEQLEVLSAVPHGRLPERSNT